MTHADIVAWWAIGIAVFTLVAHVPLSMLAHYYLPKTLDWLASRSREKLTKRIAKLERRLTQLNDPKYFEDLEWGFREYLFFSLYCLGAGLAFQAMGVIFVAIGPTQNPLTGAPFLHVEKSFPGFTCAFFLLGVLFAGRGMFLSTSLKPSKRPKLIWAFSHKSTHSGISWMRSRRRTSCRGPDRDSAEYFSRSSFR